MNEPVKRMLDRLFPRLAEASMTLREERVKIISKRVEPVSGGSSSGQAEYFVTVEFADRRRKTLFTILENFDIVIEGESGLLTYEQYHDDSLFFVDFLPDAEEASSGGCCDGCGEIGPIGRCPFCRGWIK